MHSAPKTRRLPTALPPHRVKERGGAASGDLQDAVSKLENVVEGRRVEA